LCKIAADVTAKESPELSSLKDSTCFLGIIDIFLRLPSGDNLSAAIQYS